MSTNVNYGARSPTLPRRAVPMVGWRGLCDKSSVLSPSIAGEIMTISAMKILIISSCTGKKKSKPHNRLICSDFLEKQNLRKKEGELKKYLCPAREMYIGEHHIFTVKGVEFLCDKYGKENVGFYIISAGYGLIPHDKIIAPYECTFKGMHINDIKDRSLRLGISETFKEIVIDYDLVYFLLGKQYLIALGDIVIPKSKSAVFFASKGSMKYIPKTKNVKPIMATNNEAKKYGCVVTSLKGKMFSDHVKNTDLGLETMIQVQNEEN